MADIQILQGQLQAMKEAYAHAKAVGRKADIATRLAENSVPKDNDYPLANEALAALHYTDLPNSYRPKAPRSRKNWAHDRPDQRP